MPLLLSGGREFYPAYLAKLHERVGDAFFDAYYLPVLLYLSAVKEPVSLEMLSAWGLRADRLSFSLLDLRDFLKSERPRERPETLYQVAHQDFIEYLQEDAVLSEKLKEVHGQIGRFALGRHSERWDELDFEDPLERYHLIWTLNHLGEGRLAEECHALFCDPTYADTCCRIADAQYDKANYRTALAIYDPAARCYRVRVEELDWKDFEAHLAFVMAKGGLTLARLKQRQVAIDCYEEAIAIYNRLVETEPEREEVEDELAMVIMDKGNELSQLQQPQAAIACYDEVIERYYKRLASSGRGEWEDNLAAALMNKGNALSQLQQHQAASACYEEAIERYKRLISGGRKELEEQLAAVLTCKGVLLNSLEQPQSALACHEEAIEIRKRIILEGKSELENELAMALMNKGNALLRLRQFPEAISCYEEAIGVCKQLVDAGRKELEENLAMVLANKSRALIFLEQFQAGIECCDYAIEIYKRLVKAGREELKSDLANVLATKALVLGQLLERWNEAIACFDDAIAIYKCLVEQEERNEFAKELAATLRDKGEALNSLSHLPEAITCYDNAIRWWETCVRMNLTHLLPDLMQTVRYRMMALLDLQRWNEAGADVVLTLTFATGPFLRSGLPLEPIQQEFAEFIELLRARSNEERAQLYAVLGEWAEGVRGLVEGE